jgi:site-specific DNA recombinase
MLRALLAVRLSDVTDTTTSPQRQMEVTTREARSRGMTIAGKAVDLDVSAIKMNPFERPELGDWLNNKAAGRFPHRLARRSRPI